MITAAEVQMVRNADLRAVLQGIDTVTGSPYATSTLLDVTKITQNSKAPYFYTPSRNIVTVTQHGAALSGINFGTATVVKALKALLVSSLLAGFAPLAQAHIPYPGCYSPPNAPSGKLWYFDPVNGTTVSGGADGSAAHPFKDLAYAFQTGANSWVAGYPHQALVSSAAYDHYPKKGVHGLRADDDWNPSAAPDPNRINPGDGVVLKSGNYGDINVSTNNVDANGNTLPIWIEGASGAIPMFNTIHVNAGSRGLIFYSLRVESTATHGAAGNLFAIGGSLASPTQDIFVEYVSVGDWGTSLAANANGMPAWSQADWRANMRNGIVVLGAVNPKAANPLEPIGGTSCISLTNNVVRYVESGIQVGEASAVEIQNNTISHFADDSVDVYSSYSVAFQGNTAHDRFDVGDGIHPDFLQLAGTGVPGTFEDVTIYHNSFKQLQDPTVGTVINGVRTPPPGDVQGIDATNNGWDRLKVIDNLVIDDTCLALNFGSATNSQIINNTTVWAGGPRSSCANWLTVGDTNHTASKNLVANNVIAGSVWRHSCTNGDIWLNNRVYPMVAAGAVQRITPSAVCISNGNGTLTYASFVGAGIYDGVVIDVSTPMAQVFANYAPTSALSPVNLTPTPYGPLYGTGAVTTGVLGGGLNGAWPRGSTKPNIGAL